ncbi:unnamed protein product [Heterobilharzia americana]|nr:unnamed protein product [Heterobilharzia americana]
MAEQRENAFQKQEIKGKKGARYYKSIGLGYKTPKEAIFGTYIDKKCPFTGNVRIRGRILTGIVRKMKMNRTIVIRRDYLKYVKKYNRYEKRHKNMSVHLSPCFRQCWSISLRARIPVVAGQINAEKLEAISSGLCSFLQEAAIMIWWMALWCLEFRFNS